MVASPCCKWHIGKTFAEAWDSYFKNTSDFKTVVRMNRIPLWQHNRCAPASPACQAYLFIEVLMRIIRSHFRWRLTHQRQIVGFYRLLLVESTLVWSCWKVVGSLEALIKFLETVGKIPVRDTVSYLSWEICSWENHSERTPSSVVG